MSVNTHFQNPVRRHVRFADDEPQSRSNNASQQKNQARARRTTWKSTANKTDQSRRRFQSKTPRREAVFETETRRSRTPRREAVFETETRRLKTPQKEAVSEAETRQSRPQGRTGPGPSWFEYRKQKSLLRQNKSDSLLIIRKSYGLYKNPQITNHFFERLIDEKTKNSIWQINQNVWNNVAKKKNNTENFVNLFNNTKFNY